VETEEDNSRRDNDLLNTPSPDYDSILFAPGDSYAFDGKATHDNALIMFKEVLQTRMACDDDYQSQGPGARSKAILESAGPRSLHA
jgi:hypothetical protein